MDFKNTVMGLELGSTRVKAVLLDKNHNTIATGGYDWENHFENGVWTYHMDEIHMALQKCFADLQKDVKSKFGEEIKTLGAIGISGMMHGYLPFDKNMNLLAEFRTWRNTITGEAAQKLTGLFDFNVPQRWSISHLYQAMLNKEPHVSDIDYLTTLAGYIHMRLTGERVMGVGEASGMFPIDSETFDYDQTMISKFNELSGIDVKSILPKVLRAGDKAGVLTPEGALFLDPSGTLEAGIPLVPCEGDAGTGMVATNSVRVRTGNVSAGTSDFAMIVTDKKLSLHKEIDMVTTPDGMPVAMVHCNNCTSDINAWAGLFEEFANAIGVNIDKGELFTLLFKKALEGEPDCGGLLSYNYFSGEHITELDEGRPVFLRKPDSNFTLANFMRTHLLSSLSTLKLGMDILSEEDVKIEKIYGHGGFFKTPKVGQTMLSAAINAPVSVMETAGEGGPYGMALLAAFGIWKSDNESLPDYLDNKVFNTTKASTIEASKEDIEGFDRFAKAYKKALSVERCAVNDF